MGRKSRGNGWLSTIGNVIEGFFEGLFDILLGILK